MILWNQLNSWGPIFVDCWFFAYLWGCNFVDVLVFSFSNAFKTCFVEDVNSWGRANHENHENSATMNSNDSTVVTSLIIEEIV